MPPVYREHALDRVAAAAAGYFAYVVESERARLHLSTVIREAKRLFPSITQEQLARMCDHSNGGRQPEHRLSRQRIQQILSEE